jgi:hypothetical protein
MAMASWVKSSLVLFGLGLTGAAAAQPAGETAPAAKPAATKPAEGGDKPAASPAPPAPAAANSGNILVEKTNSGQKLFRITEGLVVEGQRQKPNAFYVLQRASTPYDWDTLEENFLPRILKAAEKPPF